MYCGFLDSIPVVGHVKGGIHYAVGDEEGGRKAMLQATKSIAVLTGGAVGGAIGGPIGMVTGAALVVAAADSVSSGNMQVPRGFDIGVAGHPTTVTENKILVETETDKTSMVKTGMVQAWVKTGVIQTSMVKTRVVRSSSMVKTV